MSNEINTKNEHRSKLFMLSVALNVFIFTFSGYMYMQNSQLRNQLLDHTNSLNELTESQRVLEQQLNISESQVEYYKDLALYYSNWRNPSEPSASVLGTSSIPIVALQAIQNGFQTDYQGVVMAVDIELEEGSGRILVARAATCQ
jgi:hypothetical protein